MTLNHSFLMYFMVRNMMTHSDLGALYTSRRFSNRLHLDLRYPDTSEFIFGIRQIIWFSPTILMILLESLVDISLHTKSGLWYKSVWNFSISTTIPQ